MKVNKKIRYATKNLCYKAAEKITPKGIMIHSTACPGVMADRFATAFNQPMPNGCEVCCHGFLDPDVYIQILPYHYNGWHAGGSANNSYIGIELCEPYKYSDKNYFDKIKKCAISLCADLCQQYDISVSKITTHCEGYQNGIASNHSDIDHWWKKYHNYTISNFRKDVKKELEERRMATKYVKGDSCIGLLGIKEQLIMLYKAKVIKAKVAEDKGFGDGTLNAIKEVQKLSGLKVTGEIDETTVKAVAKLVNSQPKLLADSGDVNADGKVNMEDVTTLQQKIAGLK